MDSTENSLRDPGSHSVPRRRGRPRRQSQPIVIPKTNQSDSSNSRRRCAQLRNRTSTSTEERLVCQRLNEESCTTILQTPSFTHNRTIFEPLNLGEPNHSCKHCAASFWYEEHIRRHRNTPDPIYNLCCRGGKIFLEPYKSPPQPMLDLLTSQNNTISKHFFDHIRQYNTMFAMTSMGAKVLESINDGRAPYVFKVSGLVCHRIGSLVPPRQGHRPEYAQLYIYDTEHEVRNRINITYSVDPSSSRPSSSRHSFNANEDIFQSLISMLNTHNPIVKLFRTARERLSANALDQFIIRIFGTVDAHGDIYSAPVTSEVVGLVVGDIGSTDVGRDIIIDNRSSGLQQINEKHCKFMAMQYPLLFPYGENGYHEDLTYRTTSQDQSEQHGKITMLEYYAYRLHDRPGDFNTPLRGRKLTQAYEVDGFCCVEEYRIAYYRKPSFQKKL